MTTPSAENKSRVDTTVAALRRFQPVILLRANARSPLDDPKTPQEMLDRVIARLTYQKIRATAEGDDPAASRLGRAIHEAQTHRASHAFLRPALAYLRSVFANTQSQENPQINAASGSMRNLERMRSAVKNSTNSGISAA